MVRKMLERWRCKRCQWGTTSRGDNKSHDQVNYIKYIRNKFTQLDIIKILPTILGNKVENLQVTSGFFTQTLQLTPYESLYINLSLWLFKLIFFSRTWWRTAMHRSVGMPNYTFTPHLYFTIIYHFNYTYFF